MATTKTAEKGTDFILRLSGIELPADVKERIAAELRATLMRELAKTDTGGATTKKSLTAAGGVGGGAILFHPDWYGGLILRNITNLGTVVGRFDKIKFEAREVAL